MVRKGGHRVQKGTYWSLMNGQRVDIGQQEGILPGDSKTMYIKAPAGVVLLAGPALGLLYAVFLPFIGIAMALGLAAKKIFSSLTSAATKSVSFGWRPVEAYLTGKKKKKEGKEAEKDEQKN